MNKKCIILTGGGTAGHVTVNINLQNELKKHFDKIVYIGSENGIEKSLIQNQTPFTYTSIP
ncbi:MAG: glycosyltransferase, partial [Clostridia bacterium]|nr:glycosyltransferase [Clostridia bacterium]